MRNIVAWVAGVIIGAVIALVGLPAIEQHITKIVVAFVLLIVIIGLLVFFIVSNKSGILMRLFGVKDSDLGELQDVGRHLVDDISDRNWPEVKAGTNHIIRRMLAWYSWINFRRWIVTVFQSLFLAFSGLFGTVLLYNQNKLLIQQNQLMVQQNKRLDQQTYLQEAERRSSLIFLMGNILDAINQELRADVEKPGARDLSPQLIGRIIALSSALKPYKYLSSDSLVQREISPERGHLLLSILSSELDYSTLRRIYRSADFSYADLQQASLSGDYMAGAHLKHADFTGAAMDETDLSGADLSDAILVNVVLARSNLSATGFRAAELKGANLRESNLVGANFQQADLRGANLYMADLSKASLSEANLTRADLNMAILKNTKIQQVVLDSAMVDGPEWLRELSTDTRDTLINRQYVIDSFQTELGMAYRIMRQLQQK